METKDRIFEALEEILDQDWPNEIKADRIFKDIVQPYMLLVEEVGESEDYEDTITVVDPDLFH